MGKRSIRVLIAKVGLDGHERGAWIIARALMRAGMEVIYTGLYQTTGNIVKTAIQEDVDVIGVSSLAGGHMAYFTDILEQLNKEGRQEDILLIGGGVIPLAEAEELKRIGVSEIFRAGARTDTIVKYIEGHVRDRASKL